MNRQLFRDLWAFVVVILTVLFAALLAFGDMPPPPPPPEHPDWKIIWYETYDGWKWAWVPQDDPRPSEYPGEATPPDESAAPLALLVAIGIILISLDIRRRDRRMRGDSAAMLAIGRCP